MTHRPGVNIIPIHGKSPKIHDSAFIAPGCTIIGDVEIGADSSIWYNCVLRADVSRIVIGARTNIQDGSVCHCDPPRPGDPDGSPLIIGDDVLIGHMAMVHGCTIQDRGFVGLGAIAMNKSVIGSDAMLAAGAIKRGAVDTLTLSALRKAVIHSISDFRSSTRRRAKKMPTISIAAITPLSAGLAEKACIIGPRSAITSASTPTTNSAIRVR